MPLMLPTLVRNLFGCPATRLYPVQKREPFAGARGQIRFDEKTCILCGNCARQCPAVAIEVSRERKELTFYPGRCIVCGICIDACRKNSITMEPEWRAPFYEKPVEVYRRL